MPRIIIVFDSAATAEFRVAGIPAAARALRAIAEAFPDAVMVHCVVATDRPWTPSATCQAECMRLAPRLRSAFALPSPAVASAGDIRISGEALIETVSRRRGEDLYCPKAAVEANVTPLARALHMVRDEKDRLAGLRRAGHAIVAATGKPGDGIVSRFVNRPISQTMTRWLLRLPGLLPIHATLGAGALGIAMALFLLLDGNAGLIVGAILFQAASIVDGVDGELARATFRTSDRGAMLDSVIDALTNLAFILGLTLNRGMGGDLSAATAGGAGLAMLATGLFLIGRRARQSGQPVNFDVIKVHFRKRRSRVMEWMIWFTMRDFFAAAGALLIVVGLTRQALYAFATVTAIWLIVTVSVLVRTSRRNPVWSKTHHRGYTDSSFT